MKNYLYVFFISMVPLIELRGAIPVAYVMKAADPEFNLLLAYILIAIGNMIPVPLILLFITPIFAWLKTTDLFRPLVEKLETRSLGKSEQVRKYEFWGLVLFVGIPLPGTGAWTGSLIAALLGVDRKKAVAAVLLGILIATVIMTAVSYGLIGRVV